MKKILALLLLLTLVACNMQKSAPILKDTVDSKYRVGDEYTFKACPAESNSMLTIVKVEHQDSIGNIIHVYVNGDKDKTSVNPEKYSTVITHMPFSEAALDASGLRRTGKAKEIPDYQEGYDEWRTSFDKGEAGVFAIPVSKAVEYTEKTMLEGRTVKE